MRRFSTLKTLALAAGMMLTGTQTAGAKADSPSSGNIVISKVFYSGSKRIDGQTPVNYMRHLYIQLYNNSANEVELQGMYVALANTDGGTAGWLASDMTAETKITPIDAEAEINMSGKAVVKQIMQISPDASYIVQPGQSVVIVNCAIDHSEIAAGGVNLSGADFEVKSTNNGFNYHNDAVPEIKLVHTFGTSDFINFMNPGPDGIVLLQKDANITRKTYGKGKTTGNTYVIVDMYKSVDAVDIVLQKTPSADNKRFTDSYDAGYTCTTDPGTFSGQAVVRKTAFICPDGRKVLFDTDNSSVDFESTTDLSIRSYSEEVSGLDETQSITIPESGYLAINPAKPFCGPKDVTFSYVNVSNNAATTDMTYYQYAGNEQLLIAGTWIAIAQPGTYDLKLSTSQGTMKTRSSGLSWSDEDELTLSGSKANSMIYKFQNTAGQIGFKRVTATTEGKYNHATFSDGDRMYYAISEAIADKIAAKNGATDHTNLEFIAWHGAEPVPTGITNVNAANAENMVIYNLQGVRLNQLQKGLNIVNGKKVVMK